MSSIMIKAENIVVDSNEYNSDEGEEMHLLEDTGGDYHHSFDENMPSPLQRNVVTVNHSMATNGKETSSSGQPKNVMENEKRIRREIANSNERRRMQSINAGFQSLRGLLPHHEGEKLSKAAILQQTSQYIIDLEREKTHLLSQNCQLKRLLGQHEIVNNVAENNSGGNGSIVLKKRKLTDNVMSVQTISDSSDEGLGSMSPEPVTLLTAGGNVLASKVPAGQNANSHIKEMTELKSNLQTERKQRSLLEERIRQLEQQIYPSNQFIEHEVIEHTDNVRDEEISVVEIDQSTQIVLCSPVEKMHEEEAEMLSDMNLREEVILTEETIEPEYVDLPSRLQPILEAAIKAEPKVEVERINETVKISKINGKDGNSKQSNGRMFVTTSRQNLDTIVEAIRHLEGDHMFDTGTSEQLKKVRKTQEVPLALTKVKQTQQQSPHTPQNQRKLKAELSPFLQLKNPNGTGTITIVSSSIAASASPSPSSLPLTANKLSTINNSNHQSSSSSSTNITLINKPSTNNGNNNNSTSVSVLPASTIVKFPSSSSTTITAPSTNSSTSSTPSSISTQPAAATQVTITTSSLKQCRPGVIVAKQLS